MTRVATPVEASGAFRDRPSRDADRSVQSRQLESGLVRITADLQPDKAALVMKAIEAARRVSEETSESGELVFRAPAGAIVRATSPPVVLEPDPVATLLSDQQDLDIDDTTALTEAYQRHPDYDACVAAAWPG